MQNTDYIKNKIETLYKTNPNVHISVKESHPKVVVSKKPARIVGVYRNIFLIEETHNGSAKRHTFQYADVFVGQVVIEELGGLIG